MKWLPSPIKRAFLPLMHAKGPLFCPVCERPISLFEKLSSDFTKKWQEHRFDLDPGRLETLNLDQYSCPLCHSSDRDRLYAMSVSHLVKSGQLPGQGTFVEFAPNPALSKRLRQLLPGWTYRTADLFMDGVDDQADICDMRQFYADGSVDMLLCSHVLEHVDDDTVALRELHRILKPGGLAILMVPIHLDLVHSREGGQLMSETERWARFGQGDHVRIHAKTDWIDRIRQSGFELLPRNEGLPEEQELTRCGIAPGSVLYIARKPSAQ